MRWRKSPTKTGEREKIAVWLEHDQLKALRALLERDGVPIAEQIRRGMDLWIGEEEKIIGSVDSALRVLNLRRVLHTGSK